MNPSRIALLVGALLVACATMARADGPVAAKDVRASMMLTDSILITRVDVDLPPVDSTGHASGRWNTHRVSVNHVKGPWMKRFAANLLPEGTELRSELCPTPRSLTRDAKPWMCSVVWVNPTGRGQVYVDFSTGCALVGLAGGVPGGLDVAAHADSLFALFKQGLFADSVLKGMAAAPKVEAAASSAADQAPEVISRVAPVYPDSARSAHVEGTVLVQALVGADGFVEETRVKTSVPGLDQAAQRAVRQWHFKPARHGGAPVAVWAVVPVKFSLQPDAPAPKR